MQKTLIAGIDIGGTKIAVALAETDGEKIFHRRFPTRVERGAKTILDETLSKLETQIQNAGAELKAIGIGCAGPLDLERGLVLSPLNLPGWNEFPLVETFRKRFGVPVMLDNDANAAALGESKYGAGRGFENIVYMTISTGIGGGIIVNGKLVRRVGAGAGAIGHITVAGDGIECGCGGRGCLEAICSGTNIARRAVVGFAENGSFASAIKNPNDITAKAVVEAVRQENEFAQKIWNETIRFLGVGLGSLIVTLAPETVIMGGVVSLAGEAMLFEPLRREVHRRVKILLVKEIKILPAGLKDESGIYGALALARLALEK